MNIGKENEFTEFKKSTGEAQDAMKSVSSILNKHGHGEIYFGVLNDGTVVGQQVSDTSLRDISRFVRESIEPAISPIVREESFDGKNVIHLVFSGSQKPYSSKGVYYIRVSDEDLILKQNELFRIMREMSYSDDWENRITDKTLDDVDDDVLKRFFDCAKSCGRLTVDAYNKEALLSSLGLAFDGKINNACFSLFGKDAGIPLKLANFATNEKLTFLDLKEFHGNIYTLVDVAIEYIMSHIDWEVEIGNRTRREIPEIPEKAIREIVVNAFAHARYSDRSTEHEINIHPGKIVIYNPGPFPDNLTPNDYIATDKASLKRNPLILDILFRSKAVEKEGSGFKRADRLLREKKLKWSFTKDSYGFYFVFIRADKATVTNGTSVVTNQELSDTDSRILGLLSEDSRLTVKELSESIGKSSRTVLRSLKTLTEKGYIERIGKTKGYWKIK